MRRRLLRIPTIVALVVAAFVAPSAGEQGMVHRPPEVNNNADPTVSRDDADGTIYRGTQNFVGYLGNGKNAAAGDVTLNYPNVDVHEVAKSLLGDLLGLNYAVDQSVSGTVSVVTAEPVSKAQVLPIFEAALKASNLALERQGDIYTIIPLAAARKQPYLTSSTSGYGTEAVQLRFVNPTDLKKLLDPLVPEGGIAQADPGRNLLLITGTGAERAQMRQLIRQFDVNWMHGMSFALFMPKNTDSRSLAAELDAMINAPGSPAASVVRLLSLERLNAVLAISSEPQYLTEIKKWVSVLDRLGAQGERKLFVYRVQNGRAADLAKSLAGAFGQAEGATTSPNGATTSTTVTKQTPAAAPPVSGFNDFSSTDDAANADQSTSGGSVVTATRTISIGSHDSAVTISADETNNAILVYATARQYAVVQDALSKLDILPLQVMIEAAIAEVTLTNDLRYGVQWYFNSGGHLVTLTQNDVARPLKIFPGFQYFFRNESNSINAALDALSGVTTVKVISAPKLMVLNNHTAALQVGDQVPVATQSSVSTDNPNAPIVNSIEYRDTGVILKVTPRVNDSGLILLDIAQEVSDVSSTSSSTIDSPTIQQRRISSSVAIQDGQTIALGGLIRDNSTRSKSGLPLLSQIPVLGALFGNTDNMDKRTELLVLLTPRVVRNPTDAQNVTEELEQKLQSVQPLIPRKPH